MAELNKAAAPALPGGFYARLRGKLGVSRIRTGDEMVVRVAGLGELVNPVVAEG